LEKSGFSGLPWGVKHPIELIRDIPVELGADKAFFRRQHIVHFRAAVTGGIEKPDFTLIHSIIIHGGIEKESSFAAFSQTVV
jgi:hypothetical protein